MMKTKIYKIRNSRRYCNGLIVETGMLILKSYLIYLFKCFLASRNLFTMENIFADTEFWGLPKDTAAQLGIVKKIQKPN